MNDWIKEITSETNSQWSCYHAPADFASPFEWGAVLPKAEECESVGTVVLNTPERYGMEAKILREQGYRVGLKCEENANCIMLGTEKLLPILKQAQNVSAAVIDMCDAGGTDLMMDFPNESLNSCINNMRALYGMSLLLLCDDSSYPYALLHYAVAKQCGVDAAIALLHPNDEQPKEVLRRRCEVVVQYVSTKSVCGEK